MSILLQNASQPPCRKVTVSKQSGFTLIELLVVISIISLLVSILLPSLKTARTLARRAVCLTQLRTIGTASMMYVTENEDGQFPYGIDTWPEAFAPYTGEEGANGHYKTTWRCPEDRREHLSEVGGWNFFRESSYGVNAAFTSFWEMYNLATGEKYGPPISRIAYPAKQILLAERGMNDITNSIYWDQTLRAYHNVIDPWDRHGGSLEIVGSSPYMLRSYNVPVEITGTLNFLFPDGHASPEDKDFSFDPGGDLYHGPPWNYTMAQ